MEKRFKNSLVLGKIYPPHLGHLYLIDTARSQSENVHVIMTHNKQQSIPGEVRYEALKSIYKDDPKVNIYIVSDDGLPQHPDPNKPLQDFYDMWVPLVYNQIDKLDVVFTSEEYGEEFAQFLGIEHVLVDKNREKYPISGTEVRNNPYKNWDFIPKEIRHFFVKRVVIMGPESCGKSTLTENLSKHYNTNFVIEYGRVVYENNGNSINIDDFIPISEGRQSIEDECIKLSNKLLFCDTEDITTYIFSKMFFPNDYKKVEDYFTNVLDKKSKYDLYILLTPDCDSVQDGTRSFLDDRWEHYDEIKSELVNRNCKFIEIGGSWNNRFEKSIIEINSIL